MNGLLLKFKVGLKVNDTVALPVAVADKTKEVLVMIDSTVGAGLGGIPVPDTTCPTTIPVVSEANTVVLL